MLLFVILWYNICTHKFGYILKYGDTTMKKVAKVLLLGIALSVGNSLVAVELQGQIEFKSSYNMTWTEITIESEDVTLEDLASTYYGDIKDAYIIYNANSDVIGKDKKLHSGMHLKIPITDKFRDQPEHLGWR